MKKRLLAVLMAAVTVFAVGCSGNQSEKENETTTGAPVVEVKDALEIFTNTWSLYGEDEKFPACGGDMENASMEGPGKMGVSDAESLDYVLGFPEDSTGMIDDCASLMHMMNANTFTAGAYHVADAENVETLATSIKDNILARQWMCGFPEKLIIVQISDDYLVSAFGHGEPIDLFMSKLSEAYPGAELLFEEPIE